MRTLAALLITLSLAVRALGDDDEAIFLRPVVEDESLPEKMLIMIPGGKVPNERYVETAAAIQKSASHLRLWIAIPSVFQRLCIIQCSAPGFCAPLHGAVEAALSKATAAGWKRGADEQDIWLAGHSLGGVCANSLFQAYSGSGFPYAGLIVMGSYVDEDGAHDLVHYPKPVLTLNAELDGGLARPGKTAVWWRQHEAIVADKGEDAALSEKPVIVLPGLNHSDFCPGFDVPGDLPAEVDQASATSLIGRVVAAFLHSQTTSVASEARRDSLALIKEKVTWTRGLLTPYLKAQDMERTASSNATSVEGASPFCAEAQRILAGLTAADDKRLRIADGFHLASSNLEHCHPNWTQSADGDLNVLSCSHADYYPDFDNTGTITAASQIACKMLSSDRVAQQLNTTAADANVNCSTGNVHAVTLAESMAAPSTLERFRRQGKGWCFAEDTPTLGNVGPLWVFKDALELSETPTCMSVSSPVLRTGLNAKIFPGSHYCKFLSPARVLDWMMTDGLKSSSQPPQRSQRGAANIATYV